jgi:secondary thiamine-phosphate synthase enzyme
VDTTVVELRTGHERGIFDVTDHVRRFVADLGDGLVSVFVPHATAGLAIIEVGAGSDADLIDTIDDLVPRDDRYRHRHGSPGHGDDHVIPGIVSPSLVVPVIDGSPALGTWQSIVLVDPNLDNTTRQLRLSFLPA